MRSFLVFLFIIFAGLSAAMFYLLNSYQNLGNVTNLLPYSDSANSLLNKIQQEILTPSPLTGSLTDTAGTLTIEGVFQETNKHRSQNKVAELTLNKALSEAARTKLDSMFAKQYFEHVSPDGIGPANLVDNIGYQYIRVGENLALGNYQNDTDLVQAWMDSPGHRRNILSQGFSEIGIAVGQGQFQEHNTWLAVQTFALPSTTCPQPDPVLQSTFNQKKIALDALSQELSTKKNTFDTTDTKLDDLRAEISKLSDSGNEKINQGNTLVKQGNEQIKQGNLIESNRLQREGQDLQQKGQTLIQQASDKQDQLEQLAQEQNQQRSAYNQQTTQFNELNKEVIALVAKINQQIRNFNSCAKQYSN